MCCAGMFGSTWAVSTAVQAAAGIRQTMAKQVCVTFLHAMVAMAIVFHGSSCGNLPTLILCTLMFEPL